MFFSSLSVELTSHQVMIMQKVVMVAVVVVLAIVNL